MFFVSCRFLERMAEIPGNDKILLTLLPGVFYCLCQLGFTGCMFLQQARP